MRLFKINNIEVHGIDSPERTIIHGKIIKSKYSLFNLYVKWYKKIKELIKYQEDGVYIELGSGSGFIKEIMPSVQTSDILKLPNVDLNLDACKLPFPDNSIDGIILIDTFHHIPNVEAFLNESQRVLKEGGYIVMSEPYNSSWGKFVYSNFHHEPFDTKANWTLDLNGPLSSANGALPWIVFERDSSTFSSKYPNLEIDYIEYHTPISYLISGGLSYKELFPNFIYKAILSIENKISNKWFSMFVYYRIKKAHKLK